MVVTEQVDALRMCAADPNRLPGQSRDFLASVVMTTVLHDLEAAGVATRDRK